MVINEQCLNFCEFFSMVIKILKFSSSFQLWFMSFASFFFSLPPFLLLLPHFFFKFFPFLLPFLNIWKCLFLTILDWFLFFDFIKNHQGFLSFFSCFFSASGVSDDIASWLGITELLPLFLAILDILLFCKLPKGSDLVTIIVFRFKVLAQNFTRFFMHVG